MLFCVPHGLSTAGAFCLPLFPADARIAPAVRTLLFGSPWDRTAHRAAKNRFRHITLCAPQYGVLFCVPRGFSTAGASHLFRSSLRRVSTRGSNTALRIPQRSHGASRREEQIPPYRALRTPDVGVPFYAPRGFSTAGAFCLPLFSADARIAPAVRTLLFGSPRDRTAHRAAKSRFHHIALCGTCDFEKQVI